MQKTFKIFDVDGQKYLYDRYSNEFLSLPDEVAEKIEKAEDVCDFFDELRVNNRVLCDFDMPDFSFSPKLDIKTKVTKKMTEELNNVCFVSTEDCNLRCKYCVYSDSYKNIRGHNSSNPMSVETAKKYLDNYLFKANPSNGYNISFYGGEALLEIKKIMEISEYAKAKSDNIRFFMNTNLTLLTESIMFFLVKNRFTITISLDGPKEIHDKYRLTRNQKPTYEIVMNNLKRIREYDEEYFKNCVLINTVIVPHTFRLDLVDEFFSQPLFDGMPIEAFNSIFLNVDDNDFFDKNDVNAFLERFHAYALHKFTEAHINGVTDFSHMRTTYNVFSRDLKKIHYRLMDRLDDFGFYWPGSACIPGMRSIFVNPKGEFFPCEECNDYNEFSLGNINDGFNTNEIVRNIEDYVNLCNKSCKKCWAYRFCSHCYSASYKNNKLNPSMMLGQCDGIKKSVVESFKLYLKIYALNPSGLKYLDGQEAERMYPNMIAD